MMPLLFKISANSSAMETIDDWDPRNLASFKILTKIGSGEYWLISATISASFLTSLLQGPICESAL